jgi:tight adherence protein B
MGEGKERSMGIVSTETNFEYTLGLIIVFIGVCLFFSGVYHLVVKPLADQKGFRRRLLKGEREKLSQVQILKSVQEDEKSLVITLAEYVGAWGKIENLQRTLLQGDIFWKPSTFISVMGIFACAGFVLGHFMQNFLVSFGLAGVLGVLPVFFLKIRKRRKSAKIEKQMPECMELLARSLRAGHALPSAIDLAGKEIPYPLGTEMKVVYEEQRLGLGLNAALRRMGERVSSQDMQYFITAVTLQSETGGNLAEVMEKIGYLIRERLKLKGKVQALTAEGRMSVIILTLLPIVVFIALYILNPKYLEPLFKEAGGFKVLIAGGVSMGIGVLWMKKIIRIRV